MCRLSEKEVKFEFDEICIQAFEVLKKNMIEAQILISLNWKLSFELMCDASDVVVGAVLGQQKEKVSTPYSMQAKLSILRKETTQ